MEEHGRSMSEAAPPPAAGRSTWVNLRDVVLAPSATFADVRERPRWLAPLLFMAAAALIGSYFLMPLTLEMQKIAMASRDMTPEKIESALPMVKIFSLVGGPIGLGVISAVIGLLLWGWAAISGAPDSRYKVAFTATVYTGVIWVLQSIAQVIVVKLKGAEQVALEGAGPPTFGLALFLPERGDMPKLLYGLLANINFFAIWTLVVVAISGTVAMKMSKGAAYGFAIVMWLIGGVMLAFIGMS
jgi:hypothetical protein